MRLSVLVEPEAPGDEAAIYQVNTAAFDGRTEEADLVGALRDAGDLVLSLVARYHGEIVGHVAFSRVSIDDAAGPTGGVALAPVGVRSELQDRGVGRELIERGIKLLSERGETVILVVGNPTYYTRFGFTAAAGESYPSVYSGAYFMALLLGEANPAPAGPVTYPDAFELVN